MFQNICLLIITLCVLSIAGNLSTFMQNITVIKRVDNIEKNRQEYLDKFYGRNDKK